MKRIRLIKLQKYIKKFNNNIGKNNSLVNYITKVML